MSSTFHLLAGGPGSDFNHTANLLRGALERAACTAPRVACVGAANGDHPKFFHRMSELFLAAGAGAFVLAPTANATAAESRQARAELRRADVLFLGGGDVSLGMQTLQASGLVPCLAERCAKGVPFVGLSAGSILLCRQWIAWSDPEDDATGAPFDCLGLVPLLCDTHAEADDWSELRALLRFQPAGTPGYGISSRAMLKVHPDGRTETIGGDVVVLRSDTPLGRAGG